MSSSTGSNEHTDTHSMNIEKAENSQNGSQYKNNTRTMHDFPGREVKNRSLVHNLLVYKKPSVRFKISCCHHAKQSYDWPSKLFWPLSKRVILCGSKKTSIEKYKIKVGRREKKKWNPSDLFRVRIKLILFNFYFILCALPISILLQNIQPS